MPLMVNRVYYAYNYVKVNELANTLDSTPVYVIAPLVVALNI